MRHDDRDENQTLSEAFWSVAHRMRRTSVESLAQWDLSPSQFRVLRVLGRHGEMRLSELSDHLRIAARSTTDVVDGLEAKGILARRSDPTDRRATLVALTAAGGDVGKAIKAARGEESERVFDNLSQTDRAHLARILRKLGD